MKLQSQTPFAPIDWIWSFSMTFLQKVKYFNLLSTIFHFHNISQNSPDLDYSNKKYQILVVKRIGYPEMSPWFSVKKIWINNIFRIFAHLINISIFDIFFSCKPSFNSYHFWPFSDHSDQRNYWKYQCYLFVKYIPFSLMGICYVFQVFFFRFIHSCIEMRMCFTAKWNH